MDTPENEITVQSTDGSREVSFQVFQDIYNSLTGKTERIVRTYFNQYHTRLSDFEDLHHRISQMMEQYDCKLSNIAITVRYSNSRSERHSSFERFKMQAPGRNSCVETIEFEYGFLIILPKTREAKNYKLEIFLVSGVGLEDRLRKLHADRTEMLIMRSMGRVTGRIDVDYIDLAVGRNIESQVDEWFLSLAKIGPNWFSKFTLAISDNLTIITRFLFLSVLSVAGIWYLSPIIIDMRSLFLELSAIIVFGIFLNSLAFSVSASFEQ